jgi:hypothetical protein
VWLGGRVLIKMVGVAVFSFEIFSRVFVYFEMYANALVNICLFLKEDFASNLSFSLSSFNSETFHIKVKVPLPWKYSQ